ncbi:MAG: hypothetical protein ACNYPI_01380 [Arenicellales bacterium WSBS_2016_MAG_OTU3]
MSQRGGATARNRGRAIGDLNISRHRVKAGHILGGDPAVTANVAATLSAVAGAVSATVGGVST